MYQLVEDEERMMGRAVVDLWPVMSTLMQNSLIKGTTLCGSRPSSEKANALENLNLMECQPRKHKERAAYFFATD